MNDKRTKYRWLAALPALLLLSCSQEEMMVRGGASDADDIIFHVALPGVETGTRSYDDIQKGQLEGGFTVAAHNLDMDLPVGSKLPLYFEEALVTRTEGMGDAFRGDGCKWPDNKDGKKGNLRFYAFYPSIDVMKEKSGFNAGMADVESGKDYFLLHDISEVQKTGNFFSYRIGNFKVNRDILRHMDFVAATALGNKTDNLYSGVSLEFSHKLSRIDFKAWSGNTDYELEIAGVRIGGAIVSTTFNMEGNWIYGSATEKKPVEYIFRAGDTLVNLDGISHNTEENPTSIMGNGGWAMIIPGNQNNNVGKYTAWNKTATNTTGVYFSVLMRVIDKTDDKGLVLYPYADNVVITGNANSNKMNVVYLVVEKETQKVIKEIYKNTTSGLYYSDKTKTTPYSIESDEDLKDEDGNIKIEAEIRSYGWAAIPYEFNVKEPLWEAGKTYSYTFNYSKGIGIEGPDEAAPGKPIIKDPKVDVTKEEDDWKMVTDYENEEFENFDFEQL